MKIRQLVIVALLVLVAFVVGIASACSQPRKVAVIRVDPYGTSTLPEKGNILGFSCAETGPSSVSCFVLTDAK